MSRTSAVFKAYDIRGIVPRQLDASLCRAIGSAFARFTKSPRVLLVRDMRPSGLELSEAFAEGARAEGTAVVDLGMASTDFLYFASGRLDAPGAMFTASHNPAEYNGIKLCYGGARPIGRDTGLREIEALADEALLQPSRGDVLAPLEHLDLLPEYAQHVRTFVDPSVLRPLKVVADTANGMGGLVVPLVMEGLPFDVELLYPELDGSFPNHPADPIQPENLADLQSAVLASGADVGLAFDGDADRVFLVDERGRPVSGSLTTALVAASMLEKHRGATVLYNLICSKVVPEVIAEHGGVGVRTRVGHSYIKQVMAETNAVFGGEHSGHYYFRDNYRADSGIITALVVLEMMSRSAIPLSQILAPYQRYTDSGEINTEVADVAAVLEAVARHEEAAGRQVDRLDGITVDRGDWWYNLRPSNTEPLLRLNLEAPDEASCARHVHEILAFVSGDASDTG
ncbi:MAG: phosphomannomutase/phosphoglucomutase [Actinomycetota bacterium]|jgi:phosphomannomutase|nr:phosphomannomutase/phosphoglucomutase [Actinomycetota bacterium]